MSWNRTRSLLGLTVLGVAVAACGDKSVAVTPSTSTGGADQGGASSGGASAHAGGGGRADAGSGTTNGGRGAAGSSSGGGGATNGGATAVGGASAGGSSGLTAGWLYTLGNKIYVSDGKGSGKVWVGRGVNMTDLYLCGYNNTLWMPGADQALEHVASGLVSGWKANFVRISLSMNSYPIVTSWLANAAQYKTPMTNVINALGSHPNLYVLVTLRSDSSMIGLDTASGDAEATGLPSDTSTSPSSAYPTGTDDTYVALVDSFANAPFVLFGLTNEPGGGILPEATIAAAMGHALSVIRAEEDRLGVPHHLVSVQGSSWSSNIGVYAKQPLAQDNVVYEVHGYPPAASSYTYSNLPVIIGEYGLFPNAGAQAAFYADLESKQIPSLAWDFDSYAGCAPDLLTTNQSDANLVSTAWGATVQTYLLAHAPP